MRDERTLYYIKMALMVAERSTCSRAKVGAILTNHNRVVGTGYNGGPSGTRHCIDLVDPNYGVLLQKSVKQPINYKADVFCGCITDEQGRCAVSLHAEVNAILSREGQNNISDFLIMYCTHQPCRHCYRIMKQYGVMGIHYIKPYEDEVRDLLYREWKLPMNMVRL